MIDNIEVLCHSCIKIKENTVIYFDPFKINKSYHDADLIFITHSHYDHFSEADIEKVKNTNTKIIITSDLIERTLNLGFNKDNIIIVEPNQSYISEGIEFDTIPAYNTNKAFHPKSNNWVGYIITLNNIKYYIAGDTDITEENMNLHCDVAFVPVGGTYTMNYEEASKLINIIKPQIAIPIHYGSIVGTRDDGYNFVKLLDSSIKGVLMICL